jgi:hypothetical protein
VVGDVIVWANNRHVTRPEQFRVVVEQSGGILQLSLVKAGSRAYVTLAPIRLATGTVYHWGRTGGWGHGSSYSVQPTSPGEIVPSTPASPAHPTRPAQPRSTRKEDRLRPSNPAAPKASDTPVADYRYPVRKDSSPSGIKGFPWYPPRPSSWQEVPANLVHEAGKSESVLDVANRLKKGFTKAGYGELGFYSVPGGFAMATRLEQFADDGAPLPGADRFLADYIPPKVFSLSSYVRALFRAQPGHFRVIVFIATPQPLGFDTSRPDVTRDTAARWPEQGLNKLPEAYGAIPYTDDFTCTALIYEFLRAAADDTPVLKVPGLLDAPVHLEKSGLLQDLAP